MGWLRVFAVALIGLWLVALAPAAAAQQVPAAPQPAAVSLDGPTTALVVRGIQRLILVGWRENGSVLYTAVGGAIRTYTVVVPVDTTSAAQDYDIAIGQYQLLTQLNANANNEPLRKAAVTLSRSDLITFQ